MKSFKLKNILDSLFEAICLGIIFFIPLYFSLLAKNNSIFELNKTVLFRVLVLWLLFFALTKIIIFRERFFSHFNLRYFLIPGLFFLAVAISALLSIDSAKSFFGAYNRYQGLLSLIYYLLFFVLIFWHLRADEKERTVKISRIIWAAVSSSLFVAIYGLAQIAGYDFISWSEPASLTGRITSTLGQPNFLASYLLLVIPLVAYLAHKTKYFIIRFLLIIVLILELMALFFTYSRAAWLGLIFGLFITAIIFLFTRGKNYYKKYFLIFSSISAVIILGGILLANISPYFSSRIKSSIDLRGGSIAARVDFWQSSLDAIKDRPIFGQGPDIQGEIFSKYYKKDWAVYGKVNDYPDRAHNLIFDVLLTSGIVGLMAYLALFGLFFKLMIENIKNSSSHSSLSLALSLSVFGYLISLLFGFAVAVTDVYFWLMFALMALINSEVKVKKETDYEKIKLSRFNFLASLFLAIILFLVIFSAASKEIKNLIADNYFRELKTAIENRDYFEALELYGYIKEEGVSGNYYDNYFSLALADWLDEIKEPLYRLPGEKILKETLEGANNNFSGIFLKAKIYTALANEKNNYYDLAEENFKNAIKLSPELPKNYRGIAKLYFKRKNYDEAVFNYNKALEFLPDLENPYINDQHQQIIKLEKYLIYKELAEVRLSQNLFREARDYYLLAFENYNSDTLLYKKIADTYYQEKNLDMAIRYNKRGETLNPADYSWPFAIAVLYGEKGDKTEALKYFQKALELSPDNETIKSFIK